MTHRPAVTTGVIGQPWRATITPSGSVVPAEGARLDWWVAATDRWHVPVDEPAVRQIRVESTPVTETRLRVPQGDVVQRVYSVADHGGLTVIEFDNESTLPVAVALSHRDLLTERPIADVPIEGIDLPPTAFVMPLGHRASVRVALPHRSAPTALTGGWPAGLPTATAVVRGWTSTIERAGRYVLPEGDGYAEVASALMVQRSEGVLRPMPYADDDPTRFLIVLDERVRIGEPIASWLDELALAVAAVSRDESWPAAAALASAERVLARTDETRAQRDLRRIIERRRVAARPLAAPPSGDATRGPWLEKFFADAGRLFTNGLPDAWRGQPVEVYHVPTGPTSSISYALRWHGENVAILWEQAGDLLSLEAPALDATWSSRAAAGEALLRLNR